MRRFRDSLPSRARRAFSLGLRRPATTDAETDNEIETHLALTIDALMQRGLTREDAVAEAMRRWGPLDASRDALRAQARQREQQLSLIERLTTLRHDLYYTVRRLYHAPALVAAVGVTIALGVGANATMFGIIDQLLLRPPPHVVAPEQLYRPELLFQLPNRKMLSSALSYPAYTDLRDGTPAFASVAVQTFPNPVSLGLGSDARAIQHQLVSGTFFQTLGTSMLLGRPLQPSDDLPPAGSPVVVISYGLWQREFGGERSALGAAIRLASHTYTIVGIAQKGFHGITSRNVDVWIPLSAAEGLRFPGAEWATNRRVSWLSVIARVADNAVLPRAAAQATAAVAAGFDAEGMSGDKRPSVRLLPVIAAQSDRLSKEKQVAKLLGGVSLLVLLMACTNIANLLLMRAFRRRREIAIRLAVGSSRARLVWQLLLEGFALAAVGGLASLLVVRWGSVVVQRLLLSEYAWPDSPIDGRLLLFTTLATMIVGAVTGLVPAFQGSSPALTGALRAGGRGSGVPRSRTRAILLAAQAAVSVVLLVGTGLFVRSLYNVRQQDAGVDLAHVLIGSIDLQSVGIDSAAANAYYETLEERARQLPGVADAVVAEGPPFGSWGLGVWPVRSATDSLNRMDDGPYKHIVPARYFRTMGTRIVRGREFSDADGQMGAEPVVILNEKAEQLVWKGRSALGECAYLTPNGGSCYRIIGIAHDTRRSSLAEDGPVQVYLPYPAASSEPRARVLIVRSHSTALGPLVQSVRQLMQTVRAGLPYADVKPLMASVADELRPWQLGATMFGAFGLIALLISAVGLYSVVSYVVAQRAHEMGVRIALGARMGDILRLVVGQGLRAPVAGIAVGVVAALVAAPLVQPLLFNVSARSGLVISSVLVLLLAVAVVASWIPARRASRSDPVAALNAEVS